MNKRYLKVCLVCLLALCFAVTGFCAEKNKVGIAYGLGGANDAYSLLGYQGALQAKSDLVGNLDVVVSDPTVTGTVKGTLEDLLRQQCNIVVAMGVGYENVLRQVAPLHPECQFILVDAVLTEPIENTASLIFSDQESAYLAGAAAALKSKSAQIGFIGAIENPIIQKFQNGYIAGAKSVNPAILIHSNFIGNKPIAFKNASLARDLAYQQIDQGVDVIYTVAGFAGIGAIDAAAEKGIWAIGVDVDRAKDANEKQRRHLLTSTLKRIDIGVCQMIKAACANDISGQLIQLALKNEGVDYAYNSYNKEQMAEIKDRLALIKQSIIKGEIIVSPN